MNIDKIIIKNFKNYSGEHHFDLNKKITIILGKNGFGKSSFFDAIEWCMTGRINRFNKKEFHPRDVLNFENYGLDKECKVTILFNGNNLERSFKYIDGRLTNMRIRLSKESGEVINGQTNVDKFLRNNYFRTNHESSEVFGDLIKHSHLLSQDQVSDFVSKENPKDRFKSLAEILGLKNVLYTIENYKLLKREAENKILNFDKEKEQLKLFIQERRADLTSMNYFKLKSLLQELKINAKYKDSYKQLENLKKEIEKLQFDRDRELEIYEKLLELGYTSFKDVIDKENEIKVQQKQSELKKEQGLELLNRVLSLHKSLTNKSSQFAKLSYINNEIKLKKAAQRENKYFMLKEEDLRNSLEYNNQDLEKVNFSISYIQSYNDINEFLKSYPLEKEKLEKRALFLDKRNKRINNLLLRLDQKFTEHDMGITAKLLEHLKGILNVVENDNEHGGQCPVCSTEHGDKLPSIINGNMEKYKRIISIDTNLAEKALLMKKRQVENKDNTTSEREFILNELENLQRKNENYTQRLETIKNDNLFSSEYFKYLREELIKLAEKRKLVNTTIDKTMAIKQELAQLNNQLDKIKKEVGTSTPAGNIQLRKSRLERAEERFKKYINNIEMSIRYLDEQLRIIHDNYPSSQQLEKFTTEDPSLPLSIIIHELNLIEGQDRKKLSIINELLDYRNAIDLNKRIGADIKRYYLEMKKIKRKIHNLRESRDSIENFIKKVQGIMGDETTSFLNAPNSSIQKYYRYLNPMPNSRGVQFESTQGELNIFIPIKDKYDQDILYNAKHTLSSGQLNVLAISIFLAANESQKVSKLDFIGIDDPIQNMDNVNRFSICDVLSQVDKQLIISTHDVEFVKLLVKKNEHISEELQVFLLESPSLEKGRVNQISF